MPKIKSDSSQKLCKHLHSMTLYKWPSHQLQTVAVGQCPMHIAELRTIVTVIFNSLAQRWIDNLPEQRLGYCLTWQDTQHFPRAPLGFDPFLWSILSCHTILGQSGHSGGAKQWQAEALCRAACWDSGLDTEQKIWLLKEYKEQHVRAAAVVLGLSWAQPTCSPDVKMIIQLRRIYIWPLTLTDGTMNDLYRLNCMKKAKILNQIQQAALTIKNKFELHWQN